MAPTEPARPNAQAEMNKAIGALRYELHEAVWEDVERLYRAFVADAEKLREALRALYEADMTFRESGPAISEPDYQLVLAQVADVLDALSESVPSPETP